MKKTLPATRARRYLSFQLTKRQNGGVAITQVVLDEATLFNIAVDPDYQRQGLGRTLLEHLIDGTGKTRRGDAMAGKYVPQMLPPLPVRSFRL
ncbi:hypothetical protein DMI70_23315 [Escherichia coli]|nr:hypothetical protein [Escherichia coli]